MNVLLIVVTPLSVVSMIMLTVLMMTNVPKKVATLL
jgi:hypothetical protein